MALRNGPDPDAVPFNLYRVSEPGRARVLHNLRLTPEDRDDVRHLVLDLEGLNFPYREGQSIGVLTPTEGDRRPNKLRLYSISSTRRGDDGAGRTVSLCVKRVHYVDPATGEAIRGLASNYLCDLEPGHEVAVTGPVGRRFLLPEDTGANLILVATGTGIAPFRGFLKRIYEELPSWEGSVTLVFGVRTRADALYGEEFARFVDRPGFRLLTAFSRETATPEGRRMYVQDRVEQHMESLWGLVAENRTYLYLCGLRGMEEGVEGVLARHAEGVGADWGAMRERMRAEGRFLVETY